MKYLISNNYKVNVCSPHDLVSKFKKYRNIVDGFEICPNYFNMDEIKYMEDLAIECQKNNFYFQVHGNSMVSIEEQIEFIKKLHLLSNILGYKINLVLHPITSNTHNSSMEDTNIYFEKLMKLSKNYNVVINIENLNNNIDLNRLDIFDIKQIILNNSNLMLTYDMGHILIDQKELKLDKDISSHLRNIHIHSYIDNNDHNIILKNDVHIHDIRKCIELIKDLEYNGTIVFEYNFDTIKGDTYDAKISNYVNSIELIRQYF